MNNLFYDLPNDIQLKIIMMNPHPAAELMKPFFKCIGGIEYYDRTTNQHRVYSNMHDDNTIELHDFVYTNHYIFHKPWHGYYTIREGNRVYIEE